MKIEVHMYVRENITNVRSCHLQKNLLLQVQER